MMNARKSLRNTFTSTFNWRNQQDLRAGSKRNSGPIQTEPPVAPGLIAARKQINTLPRPSDPPKLQFEPRKPTPDPEETKVDPAQLADGLSNTQTPFGSSHDTEYGTYALELQGSVEITPRSSNRPAVSHESGRPERFKVTPNDPGRSWFLDSHDHESRDAQPVSGGAQPVAELMDKDEDSKMGGETEECISSEGIAQSREYVSIDNSTNFATQPDPYAEARSVGTEEINLTAHNDAEAEDSEQSQRITQSEDRHSNDTTIALIDHGATTTSTTTTTLTEHQMADGPEPPPGYSSVNHIPVIPLRGERKRINETITLHQHNTVGQPSSLHISQSPQATADMEDAQCESHSSGPESPSRYHAYLPPPTPQPVDRQPGKITALEPYYPKKWPAKLQRRDGPDISLTDYQKDIEKRAKEVLRPYGIPKTRGLRSWLDTVLTWLPQAYDESRHREASLQQRADAADREVSALRKRNSALERERSGTVAKHAYDDLQRAMHSRGKELATAQHDLELKRAQFAQSQNDYNNACKTIQHHVGRIDELSQAKSQLSGRIRLLESDKVVLAREKREAVDQITGEMAQQAQKHALEVSSLQDYQRQINLEHEQQVAKINTDAQARIAHQVKQANATIRSQKQIIASHSRENYRPKTDDVFQLAFQTLAQNIGNLIGFVRRPDMEALDICLDARIDPTGVVGRSAQLIGGGGAGEIPWPRFFAAICWQVLVQGFFKGQPGFGVLGSQGEGYEKLRDFQELFMQKSMDRPSSDFQSSQINNKEANGWRALLFEALLNEVKAPMPMSGEKRLATLFRTNVERVARDLVETLERISGARIDPAGMVQIQATAHELGMLALDMGTQRAHLLLELAPAEGRSDGRSGRFKDEGGRGPRRGVGAIELTTQPCLRKVGDGRDDTITENVLVVGQVLTVEAS